MSNNASKQLDMAVVRDYLAPKEIDCVIYHSPCSDGYGAAFCAWLSLGESAQYIPMEHGKAVPLEKLFEKNVLIVDFSFDKETMGNIQTVAKKVLLLDHHKTAAEALEDVPGCFFDMTRSGASLAWDFFNVFNTPCPLFLRFIEDRDLWKWELEDSKYFTTALETLNNSPSLSGIFDFRQYRKFLNPSIIEQFINQGKEIIKENDIFINSVCQKASIGVYQTPNGDEYKVAMLQAMEPKLISEIGNTLCEERDCDFALIWYVQEGSETSYKVSMRSSGDVDVSEIAKAHGGGGHKHASGMIMSQSPYTLLKYTN